MTSLQILKDAETEAAKAVSETEAAIQETVAELAEAERVLDRVRKSIPPGDPIADARRAMQV